MADRCKTKEEISSLRDIVLQKDVRVEKVRNVEAFCRAEEEISFLKSIKIYIGH